MTRAARLLLAACAWLAIGCGAGAGPSGGPATGQPGTSRGNAGAGADAGDPDTHASTDMTEPSQPSPAPASGKQVLRGTFLETQEGDYVHLVIKDQAGNVRSFFIAPDMPASMWEPFATREHQGKAVEVTWEEVRRFIPEAGGEETIEEATNIRLLE